jgi:hypothetical protein
VVEVGAATVGAATVGVAAAVEPVAAARLLS